jgi:integrase/recombinase XerD
MLAYKKTVYKNPAEVYLNSLDSGVSRRNCKFALDNLCQRLGAKNSALFNWSNVNYTTLLHLKRILSDDKLSPTSVNHYLTLFKGACLNAWRLDMIDTDTYMRIKDVKRLKGRTVPKGRTLSIQEIRSLINNQHGTSNEIALRDSAIIATCYGGGLRRSELTSLKTNRYHDGALTVTGKGNIQNIVYLPDFAKFLLNAWREKLNKNAAFSEEKTESLPIFPHVKSSGFISTKPLSPRTIGDIIERRRIACKVAPFTPHDLRRTYATNLIEQGVDLFTVQKMMRHAGIETTRIYDMRAANVQAGAIKKLPF